MKEKKSKKKSEKVSHPDVQKVDNFEDRGF